MSPGIDISLALSEFPLQPHSKGKPVLAQERGYKKDQSVTESLGRK